MTLETLQQLPLFREEKIVTCKPLKGGFCNDNFHVRSDAGEYLVRQFKSCHIIEREREFERECQMLASREGIAATPLFLNEDLMVCEFAKGEHVGMLGDREIMHIAKALKKLHSISYRGEKFDLKAYFEYHVSEAVDAQFLQVDDPLIQVTRERIEGLVPLPQVLCHNDLNVKNILFNEAVTFIDWEYAGLGDRYFDLATIVDEFHLSDAETKMLLTIYNDILPMTMGLKRVQDFRLIVSVLSALWFSLQEDENKRLEATKYLENAYALSAI